jgi:anti-sigma regulatory factor (Ser/Thr protein kinase)
VKKSASRSEEIEAFVIAQVLAHPEDIARVTSEHFGISRQAINRHLTRLVDEGKLTAVGATRSRRYAPALLVDQQFILPVSASLQEDRIWEESVAPLLKGVPENVEGICFYGFTEMLNNVIDHSESDTVKIRIERSLVEISMSILDEGVGIFRKIAAHLHLEDERHAILELCKGKLTTAPTRHSGEGIFFTSRMFDEFSISSGPIALVCRKAESWLLHQRDFTMDLSPVEGTFVTMKIDPNSPRTQVEVFDRFSDKDEDYGFTRTHVPVTLARHGTENLISRSQAKRLVARFDRFKDVLLDFDGVPMIGQAFADEVFRVFQNAHPDIKLTWINATVEVEQMIRRALSHRS